ncbi:MAG: MlaE family ABC transporter permease [Chitinispirillaceae bacterium]
MKITARENIRKVKIVFWELQEFYRMCLNATLGVVRRPFYYKDLIDQMDYFGTGSLGIIILVTGFIGMALSLQISAEFAVLGLQIYTGRVVGISVITEVGPVVTALVYAGRAGSGMASEIGSMVLRHQVDTLRVFGIDPIRKLVTPRIIGSLLMLPVLTVIGNFMALYGGYYINSFINNQSGAVYWDAIRVTLLPRYIVPGIVKPFVFGFIVAAVSCFTGLSTKGGAMGLKSATTRAFVLSIILIIMSDFLITRILLFFFGYGV